MKEMKNLRQFLMKTLSMLKTSTIFVNCNCANKMLSTTNYQLVSSKMWDFKNIENKCISSWSLSSLEVVFPRGRLPWRVVFPGGLSSLEVVCYVLVFLMFSLHTIVQLI